MAPTHLTLFPSQAAGLPRKSSLKTAEKLKNTNGEISLKGVAFQVIGGATMQHQVQAAQESYQHSLFCNPAIQSPGSMSSAAAPSTTSQGPVRRSSRTRRRSSPIIEGPDEAGAFVAQEDSNLSVHTHFGSTTPPRRSFSSALQRQRLQRTEVSPESTARTYELVTPVDERDQISPLPDKTRYRSAWNKHNFSLASRTDSPARSPGFGPPMRSIFPQYDPSRPLQHQSYYPSVRAPSPPAYHSPVASSIGSPTHRQELQRYDSAVGLVDGYEHIPAAGHADLEALWKASTETYPCDGRKVQFSLYQATSDPYIKLAIGTSKEDLLYSMIRTSPSGATPKTYALKKHCPTAPCSTPVSELILPEQIDNPKNKDVELTAIFPQTAAIAAIEAVANSPQARNIATLDPTAQSAQAARLAQDAVAQAHQDYSCDLVNKARTRDIHSSTVEAQYDLEHPQIGTCAITVTKTPRNNGGGPAAKISFHHPTATPAAVNADTLNLAFLDFAHDACVLDLPGLLALDSRFVMDTVVSALLAVAVIENEKLVREQITFAAPPVQHSRPDASASKCKKVTSRRMKSERYASPRSTTRNFLARRREKREVQEVVEPAPSPAVVASASGKGTDDEMGFTRAVFGLVSLGIKGSWWIAKTSVKLGVQGVKMARKSAEGPPDLR